MSTSLRPFHKPGGSLTLNCPFCDSATLRSSRFQAVDFLQLFLLRMPVRCRNCQERSYVSVAQALKIKRESKVRRAAITLRKRGDTST
jgi:hypothetical protein